MDGDFLQQYASRQLVNGQFVKVPIISGANTDEGTAFSSQGINNTDDFNALVTCTFLLPLLLLSTPVCSVC